MKASCYARTSTLDQAREEKVSIPDQITWAKTFALERGWEWINEYIEPGVTGDTEPEERQALSRLIQDARANRFEIVLVYHSSRLAREADIGMRVCRILGQMKRQVYFRNAPIEPVNPNKFAWGLNVGSQYMMAFSFIGDFQENVARSERVRSGFQGLARRGILTFAPYGYKKIPQIITDEYGKKKYTWSFEIDIPKALIVQRIFKEYAVEKCSLRQIMLSLNKERVPSPSGKVSNEAWTATTIRNVLTNVAYIGKVRWGRKLGGKYLQGKSSTGKQKRIFSTPESWIIVAGTHPRIISDDLFSKAQERLKLRYVLRGRALASNGLLTGQVICGRCGRKAHYKTRILKRKNNLIRSDYTCSSYITYKTCKRHIMAAKKLHDIVLTEIDKIASNPKYRDKLLKQTSEHKNGNLQQELDLLKKELETVNEKQVRILRAYENKVLSLEQFGEAKRRLDNEFTRLSQEIDRVGKTLFDKSKAEEAKKTFLKVLKDFRSSFHKIEFAKQKDLLQSIISSVIVNGDRVKINFRI